MTTSTIFLASDGRHSILGDGDAIEASTELIAEVRRQGLQGWVAIMSGDYHGTGRVTLARVHGLNEAMDSDWEPAVGLFQVGRDLERDR